MNIISESRKKCGESVTYSLMEMTSHRETEEVFYTYGDTTLYLNTYQRHRNAIVAEDNDTSMGPTSMMALPYIDPLSSRPKYHLSLNESNRGAVNGDPDEPILSMSRYTNVPSLMLVIGSRQLGHMPIDGSIREGTMYSAPN
eukprot:GHVO01000833.1.p1 GENE.GHVO01000833.1~~GHVO01000833.1.p1  ORF type:complete len:142 (+),score=7.58 GHVO01000833.1:50-475(+)